MNTLKPCKDYKKSLCQEIQDWQADLHITIEPFEKLMNMPVSHLQEMLKFYEDTLKNGKRL